MYHNCPNEFLFALIFVKSKIKSLWCLNNKLFVKLNYPINEKIYTYIYSYSFSSIF